MRHYEIRVRLNFSELTSILKKFNKRPMKPIDKMRWEKFMGTVEQKIAEKWVESVERKVPHHLK